MSKTGSKIDDCPAWFLLKCEQASVAKEDLGIVLELSRGRRPTISVSILAAVGTLAPESRRETTPRFFPPY